VLLESAGDFLGLERMELVARCHEARR
jgi:hypothetical protein